MESIDVTICDGYCRKYTFYSNGKEYALESEYSAGSRIIEKRRELSGDIACDALKFLSERYPAVVKKFAFELALSEMTLDVSEDDDEDDYGINSAMEVGT